jgi:hypothetical protein
MARGFFLRKLRMVVFSTRLVGQLGKVNPGSVEAFTIADFRFQISD